MGEKTEMEKRIEKMVEEKLKNVGKTPEIEAEKEDIGMSDVEIDAEIQKLAKGEDTPAKELYICGSCGHEANAEFNPCPNCGKKLRW